MTDTTTEVSAVQDESKCQADTLIDAAEPLRTAKERTSIMFEGRGYNHPSEIPVKIPREELKLPSIIEPSLEEIMARASCNGNQVNLARDEVIAKREADFKRIAKLAPELAKGILAKLQLVADTQASAASDINRVTGDLGAIEQLIRDLADRRSRKAGFESELAGIMAQLDNPMTVLAMSKDEITYADYRAKHLPVPIAELETEIESLRSQLIAKAESSGLDIKTVLDAMYEASGLDEAHRFIQDPNFRRLHEAGYTSLD